MLDVFQTSAGFVASLLLLFFFCLLVTFLFDTLSLIAIIMRHKVFTCTFMWHKLFINTHHLAEAEGYIGRGITADVVMLHLCSLACTSFRSGASFLKLCGDSTLDIYVHTNKEMNVF